VKVSLPKPPRASTGIGRVRPEKSTESSALVPRKTMPARPVASTDVSRPEPSRTMTLLPLERTDQPRTPPESSVPPLTRA
jgi:hypothetical protein